MLTATFRAPQQALDLIAHSEERMPAAQPPALSTPSARRRMRVLPAPYGRRAQDGGGLGAHLCHHQILFKAVVSGNPNDVPGKSLYYCKNLVISMSEAIIADQIMNELKAIRTDLEFIKDHMVDIDCIMTEDDYLALNEYRKEKDSGELISHENLKKSMGL